MNSISCNIKGLNGPGKKVLKNKLITYKPDIVLIYETNISMENLNILQNNFFKNYRYTSNSVMGTIGWLFILWKNSLYALSSFVATRHSITIILYIIGSNEITCITNIYLPHRAAEIIQMLKAVRKSWRPFLCHSKLL